MAGCPPSDVDLLESAPLLPVATPDELNTFQALHWAPGQHSEQLLPSATVPVIVPVLQMCITDATMVPVAHSTIPKNAGVGASQHQPLDFFYRQVFS